METEKEYFGIELEHLRPEENTTFPFHIYVFNPLNKTYSPFLYANSPLTSEKIEFLNFIESKGGKVAIPRTQAKTFTSDRKVDEEEIPDLQEIPEHEFITRNRKRKEWREKKQKRRPFMFREELTNAVENDNWINLIDEAREMAMVFPYTISHTVSLASFLAEKLLWEDNFINRIVALSHHIAVSCKMSDPLALGELMVASFVAHLGHTQMNIMYSQKGHITMSDKEKREYKKHPGLTQHIIRKSGLIISERCNKIIYQHHERFDGNGYPEYKQGPFIEPLALILGCAGHILEYSSGKVTGDPVSMKVIIKNLKDKILSPGLELEFGETIYESLIYLLDTNQYKETEASAS